MKRNKADETTLQDNNTLTEFSKARFEYCLKMYNEEIERKERLEKKSQFYLSFITVFVSAILLNVDFLSKLIELIEKSNQQHFLGIIYLLLSGSVLLISFSLVSILVSIRIQSYVSGYPATPVKSLFSPDSEYMKKHDDLNSLLNSSAMTLTIALENNQSNNKRKALWIKISSYFIGASVLLITSLTLFIIYLVTHH